MRRRHKAPEPNRCNLTEQEARALAHAANVVFLGRLAGRVTEFRARGVWVGPGKSGQRTTKAWGVMEVCPGGANRWVGGICQDANTLARSIGLMLDRDDSDARAAAILDELAPHLPWPWPTEWSRG